MADLPEVYAVHTIRWQTTGTTKPGPDWRLAFEPFRVDKVVMDATPGALFTHDLPAHRSDEVTAEVLEGPASIAFGQAEFRSARAVLEWCVGTDPATAPLSGRRSTRTASRTKWCTSAIWTAWSTAGGRRAHWSSWRTGSAPAVCCSA